MATTNETTMTLESTERQRAYVDEMKAKAPGAGIVFAAAFLRGMRDIGYKNPAWAIAEMIDNAFQASADAVEIRLGFDLENESEAKPDMLAVIDNGVGMIPEMISYAVRWGGTDRENDRSGFGRYGYGLPSSAVSLACHYIIYSKTAGDDWHAVTVDIEKLALAVDNTKKIEQMLKAEPKQPPEWLQSGSAIELEKLESGTIVVLDELDRLKRLSGWKTRKTLASKLHQHFGVIYRHWMPERRIVVDGEVTEVVDPLFLMEHGRHFDLNKDRAAKVETRSFTAVTARRTEGWVSIRASSLPPNFQKKNPMRTDRKNMNDRWPIMRQYNGLLICREGRQIDCISPRWYKFQNYDANLKIEINFSSELDEFFGITTAKQQITIDDVMWEKLGQGGKNAGNLIQLIKDLRKEGTRLRKQDAAERERSAGEERRRSEEVMEETEKYKAQGSQASEKKKAQGAKNLAEEAEKIAAASGEPVTEVRRRLEKETRKRRWMVDYRAIEEGPFFLPKRLGEQKRVIINTDHPFHGKIYRHHDEVRAALEVLLFVLADAELDAEGEVETFYRSARQAWSQRLRHALDALYADQEMADKANAAAEALHTFDPLTKRRSA